MDCITRCKTEEVADVFGLICESALDGKRGAQNYLKRIWGEPWRSIKEKLNAGGSTWIVWYYDGISEHMRRSEPELYTRVVLEEVD